jgi:hypothetical protein
MNTAPFAILAAVMLAQSLAITTAGMLWPIIAMDSFGWAAGTFGTLSFLR